MIAPLRRGHRVAWLALAVLLPLLMILALAARREQPPAEALPGELVVVAPVGGE